MSDWDSFLKIWAIAGPLMVGGISTVYSRYTKIKDREYEKSLELDRLDRANTAKKLEQQLAQQIERQKELKAAIVNFMINSQKYLEQKIEYQNDPTPEKFQSRAEANDKFLNSSEIVAILGSETLANASINLINAIVDAPANPTPDIKERMANYRRARALFTIAARETIKEDLA